MSGIATHSDLYTLNPIARALLVLVCALPTVMCSDVGAGPVTIASTDMLHDAFPFNENDSLPGTISFDTTTAMIKTGRNTAQVTAIGNETRFDIPGDTLVACSCGSNTRVDFVFRILPGVGNYTTLGNRNTSLRLVPTAATPANIAAPQTNPANFWEQYLIDNGAMGTPGGHPAGPVNGGKRWDPNVWNSAIMDTAERNLWAVQGLGYNSEITPCRWAGMYSEQDPKYTILGIVKNRCFLKTPTSSFDSNGITCDISQTDGWPLTAGYAAENGLPLGQTYEYTKILPDGLFTPGTHVEYFIRSVDGTAPQTVYMTPDTNVVFPQPGELLSASSDCGDVTAEAGNDGHRWQQFGVLPDRWKNPAYGGLGLACMLYVDYDEGHGDERAWVTVSDLIGATPPAKYGAHNGWHVSSLAGDPNDPANFVSANGGQPGGMWDMYGVRGVDDVINGNAGALGDRLSNRASMAYATNKYSRLGPTPQMLRSYYTFIYITTGRRDLNILGPLPQRSQNDIGLLDAFYGWSVGGANRALWIEGGSFVESEHNASDPVHSNFLNTVLGADLRNPSYPALAGAGASSAPPACVALYTTPPMGFLSLLGVDNVPGPDNDVLQLNPATVAVDASEWQPWGVNGPYFASVLKDHSGSVAFTSLVDAWDLQDLQRVFCGTSGPDRLYYMKNALLRVSNVLDLCGALGNYTVDVLATEHESKSSLRVASNPVRGSAARISLTVARAGEVEVRVCDIAGRRVRELLRGNSGAGTREVEWDGRDDAGAPVKAGVYFVRARLPGTEAPITTSLVWLR